MPRKTAAPPPKEMDFGAFVPHIGQRRLVQHMRDYEVTVHAAGRRWGKSSSRRLITIDQILRSKGFIEGCIGAHSHAEAKNLWEMDLRTFGPYIVDKANEDQRRFLEFYPLTTEEGRSLGYDNLGCRIWYPSLGEDHKTFQAHGLAWAIMDEMSLCGVGAWEDTISPMLSDTGGHALLYGNAYPDGPNFSGFADLWELGNPKNHLPCGDQTCQGPHRNPRYISSSGVSWENPYGKIAVSSRQKYDDMVARGNVAKARCLYLGEFCTDFGAVFTNLDEVFSIRNFREVEPGIWLGREVHPQESVVIGIDFGKHDDKTVVVVFSRQTLEMLALLAVNKVDYLVQLPIVDRLIKRFPNRQIWSEGREETAAELLRRLYGDVCNLVKLTNGGRFDKTALVERGMDYCQRGAWRMFNVPWLKEEFQKFERTKTPKGRIEYNAPSGKHDDGVIACLHTIYGLPLLAETVPLNEDPMAREWMVPWKAKNKAVRRNPFLLRTSAPHEG